MACSNTGSLAHWVRPGMEPMSSWILVELITFEPQGELLTYYYYFLIYFVLVVHLAFLIGSTWILNCLTPWVSENVFNLSSLWDVICLAIEVQIQINFPAKSDENLDVRLNLISSYVTCFFFSFYKLMWLLSFCLKFWNFTQVHWNVVFL